MRFVEVSMSANYVLLVPALGSAQVHATVRGGVSLMFG